VDDQRLIHPHGKRFVSLCAAKILVAAKGRSASSAFSSAKSAVLPLS
jgi:hypothetical protein